MNIKRIITAGVLACATIAAPVALAGTAFADQPAEQACVVAFVKANARTLHGGTHDAARAACTAPVAPATYTRTVTVDAVAPDAGGPARVRLAVYADAGDVVLSGSVSSTDPVLLPIVNERTLTTLAADGVTVVPNGYAADGMWSADAPAGTHATATITIVVSDVTA